MLQQVHDNDLPTTDQLQQHDQTQNDHDAAWEPFGQNSNTNSMIIIVIINIISIIGLITVNEETPENALRIEVF